MEIPMNEQTTEKQTLQPRVFQIKMSKKCFRFKEEALTNHAPHAPGIYEFVVFDEQGTGTILYVGLALPPLTVHEALRRHLDNEVAPTAETLFKKTPNVYFDYVASGDIESAEDLKDIAAAFIAKNSPVFNEGPAQYTGRYSSVSVQEIEQLPGGACRP